MAAITRFLPGPRPNTLVLAGDPPKRSCERRAEQIARETCGARAAPGPNCIADVAAAVARKLCDAATIKPLRCPDPGAPGVVYLRAGSHRARERLERALRNAGRPLAPERDLPGECRTDRLRFPVVLVPTTTREAKAVLAQNIPGVGRARIPQGVRLWAPWLTGRHRIVWPEFWPDAEE